MLRRLITNVEFVAGILIILAFGALALWAPQIAPPQGDDPYLLPSTGSALTPLPPSPEHPLGTLESERDVLYGIVWGTRVAFRIGFLVTLARALIGVTVGALTGYTRGWLDALVMRVTDAFLAFPTVAAALTMLAVLSNVWLLEQAIPPTTVIPLALVLFGWMPYARLTRGNVLGEMEKEYVKAAVSVGARGRRILFRHVLPNATQGLFVLMASDVGVMVVTAAMLTFLGVTGTEPTADWGSMLKLSRNWIVSGRSQAFKYWFAYGPPTAAVLLFSLGWSLIGDGLRRVLDPRARGFRVLSPIHRRKADRAASTLSAAAPPHQ